MPKALSLKKAQPKSQKTITLFFKSKPCDTQKNGNHQDNNKLKSIEVCSGKRKEMSPIKVALSPNDTSKISTKENTEICLKKLKTDASYESIDDKIEEKPDNTKPLDIVDNKLNGNKKRSPLTIKNHDCLQNSTSCSFELIKSGTDQSHIDNKILRTPEKNRNHDKDVECPSKLLENFHNDNLFDDEWKIDEIEEDIKEDMDLTEMQRCEVLQVKPFPTRLEVRLKNSNDQRCTCFIEGVWMNTPLQEGEIVSIVATKSASGSFVVNNTSGLLSLRPDHLVSTTSVVAGVFCRRKAVLQERWRGIDSANTAMTVGILIHELVQKALTLHILDINELRSHCDVIIKESIQMLYDAGIAEQEVRMNMESYIPPLAEFMQTYTGKHGSLTHQKTKWKGHIENVLDIEENICCPKLGLKGKIDATLQVTIHGSRGKSNEIFPLELKSGRASGSAEHRGQLVLYGMMLGLQRGEEPARSAQRGLLLYLKDQADLREVSCGYPERRDLLMLRNEMVQHLAPGPRTVDADDLIDIEDASKLVQQSLPEPVHHEGACSKCPYLTICSLHLWHTNDVTVSESHPLVRLRELALGHVTSQHVQYFLHWTSLIKLEERGRISASPLHALWTDSVETRTKRGTCAGNLKIKSVMALGDRFSHTFERSKRDCCKASQKGPKTGEFCIVSLDDRPWIAAGVVTLVNQNEIHILLERDLSRRHDNGSSFHIDTYESYATTVQNLSNLGVLMEDSDRALRLRKVVIEKQEASFVEKLPRDVGRLGSKLMRTLNIEQQRAVLRTLAANDYALLQGLPGTGKTQTISVLIQMLVALKQRVLVTAHTHSAVDTVLARLPESLRVMRLGASARVAPSLQSRCEATLVNTCDTSEQLAVLYDSMEVVGVTCLGAAHSMLARTTFDVCIVDEATQVLQCTVLRPLFAAKRFLLVGDPDQLPPVVRNKTARRLGMEESLFHRLMAESSTCTLRLQYRMNQALVDVANRVAYDNRLMCANQDVAQSKIKIDQQKISKLYAESWMLTAASGAPEDAALFIDVQSNTINNGRSLANIEEACVVYSLVNMFIEGGMEGADIGVIAPYREQVSLLSGALVRFSVDVSTVDQFQGRDKSVILYSCSKRDVGDKVKEGEVLNDQRRMAVSITRAKHKCIAVGDQRALRKYAPFGRLIEASKCISLGQNDLNALVHKYKSCVQ